MPSFESLWDHVGRTLRLAGPVVISRAGILVMVTVDTIMAGQAGSDQLAYLGLGIAPNVVFMLISVGLMQGAMILMAQAFGAQEFHRCGEIWRVAIVHGLILGSIWWGLSNLMGEVYLLAGQGPELSAGADPVSRAFGWGMPGMLLFVVTNYLFESQNRPRIGMVVMITGNLLNVLLNLVFIFGWGNVVDPLEAEGAVIATSLCRWAMGISMVAAAFLLIDRRKFGIVGRIEGGWEIGKRIRRLGYPMGMTQGLEAGAFAALILLAGRLGEDALAAYQLTYNVISIFFMVAVGFAAAASVRVGNAVGRGDQQGKRLAGWVAVCLVVLVMLIVSSMVAMWTEVVVAIYVKEQAVVSIALGTLLIGTLIFPFNAAQGVLMGALRGTGDVWLPFVMHAFTFWGVAIPVAGWLAFQSDMGVEGLVWGLLIGTVMEALFLGVRFWVVGRRETIRS